MNMDTLKKLYNEGFRWLACDDSRALYAYENIPYLCIDGIWDAEGAVKCIENIYAITYADGPLRIENILKENDNNKHDAHYKALEIEPWDIMKADFTKEELKGFFKGNILKYLLRNKEGVKDVDKLINYAQELKKLLESEEK
jgi:hypothetical protein